MEMTRVGQSGLQASRLIYGCMRIAGDGSSDDRNKGKRAVHAAVEAGYTLFDHADIYGGGACEELFGEVLAESPGLREQLLIASKCGIRFAGDPDNDSPKRYDFSADYLLDSVNGSLRRLGIESLDLLMLHRPDYLMDTAAVADALSSLKSAGKVRYFGVSNFSPSQVELLQAAWDEPLVVNQVEVNIHNINALSDGTLDQCLRRGMSVQAWSPIAGVVYEAWGNTFTAADNARIRAELDRQSAIYQAADWLIALAWVMRHPARIAPVIGSTTPSRIEEAKQALAIEYRRDDWYRLLEARNGHPVP